jgi:hypothetical protein
VAPRPRCSGVVEMVKTGSLMYKSCHMSNMSVG